MLHKLDFSDDRVLAFSWEGDFSKKAFEDAMAEFVPELKTRDNFNLYLEMHSIEGMEAKAVWEDIKFYFQNMPELMEKIKKIALVTDKSWMKNLAELSYKMVPGIDLKSFSFEDKKAAREWVKK